MRKRSNFDRCYSCELCRYYYPDMDVSTMGDLYIGKCCKEPVRVQVDAFRPVCCHYEPDIETPEWYPALTKNDGIRINAKTGLPAV